ncbi:hypothetical protein JCGZ_03115 [Jatropha curcas]|uniref:Uncharacterized protein n=1 Tax=Jatropha curcas TaxID=180498 RepID=A0A067LRG6_JATCU|nr:hypothetical protein JCGZ_03115 [Jatropha curcas]
MSLYIQEQITQELHDLAFNKCYEELEGTPKFLTLIEAQVEWEPCLDSTPVQGKRSALEGSTRVSRGGRSGSENVGLSNANIALKNIYMELCRLTYSRIWFGIATAHDFESHDDITEGFSEFESYHFRVGPNLPDKEFRYLRTVIVMTAIHRGFGHRLPCHQVTNFLDLPRKVRCANIGIARRCYIVGSHPSETTNKMSWYSGNLTSAQRNEWV